MDLIDQIKYDEQGLVPAIIQDYVNNEVLMVAYMNKEAFKKTLESGQTWFWSRSRK
jgi:phosphoribosyl-ATP pyrophosphohydrolase/phosphoribosyl-AMP cyclohydrolase